MFVIWPPLHHLVFFTPQNVDFFFFKSLKSNSLIFLWQLLQMLILVSNVANFYLDGSYQIINVWFYFL